MKKRKRKNLIQIFLPKFIGLSLAMFVLWLVTLCCLKLRTQIQLREIAYEFAMCMEQLENDAACSTPEEWKEPVKRKLSYLEADVHERMPGSKVLAYVEDGYGDKIADPGNEMYISFYEMDGNILHEEAYSCDAEYLKSVPQLNDYMKSMEDYKSKTVMEDYLPKELNCYSLSVLDGYLDPKTHKFYPGNCEILSFHTRFTGNRTSLYSQLEPDPSVEMYNEHIDLTPEDTTGLVKYTQSDGNGTSPLSDSVEEVVHDGYIWMYPGNDTYEEATTCKNKHLDISKQFDATFRDAYWISYSCHLIVNTNMAEAYRGVIVFITILYSVLAILISFISSMLSYHKLMYFYKNEDYRKALMNSMAHDLKTPLTAMSGYAENLKENVMTEKREHYAQAILQNTEYMNGIISDILNLSKLEEGSESGKRQKQDLVELVHELQKEHETALKEKNLTITVEGTFKRKVNKEALKRALDNLLTNAILYTNEGGSIHVYAKDIPFFGRFVMENSPVEPIKVKSVKLWEPFVKGDESRNDRKGTGLGLSIARNILQAQGFTPKIKMCKSGFKIIIK